MQNQNLNSKATTIINALINHHLTISSAESFTGGQFAATLTAIPNSSVVFAGAIIAYQPQAKINVLNIDPAIITTYGTVSHECSQAMAEQVKTKFKTNLSFSFTGVAGPTSTENQPIGKIFITFINNNQTITTKSWLLAGNRSQIQAQAVNLALDWLETYLQSL